jgi:streptogramin lyase
VLAASQAAAVIAIPDNAQGAAFHDGALWVARSDWNWGTLDRLDPQTGAPLRRYQFAAGVEGIDFDADGRLWAVSEAGARHYFDHLLLRRIEPFFPLVFAVDPSHLQ